MVLECPHCNARLNAAAMPSPDRPVRCSKCKQVFTPAPPEESLPAAAAGGDDSDWSNMAASTPVETEKKTRATPTPAKKFPTLLVAGAGVGLLAVVGGAIAIAVFAFGDKSKQQNADANQSGQPATTKKDVTPRGASPKNVPQARPQVPVEYTDLFKETTDRPVRIPILKKIDAGELLAPGFAFVSEAAPSAGKRSKDEVVAEIKKSTALIETHLPDGSGGSGSGFVIAAGRDGILVATNFHVVGKMNAGLLAGTQIAAVFDSGLPTQKAYLAKVMASDPEADLAILKVPPFEPLPKPIDPNHAPKLVEAMDVYICGFPLGNPSFSIGNGTVSSIRREKGKISAVQINGAINHGNSGGPIVDTEGRLVGIAHARVLDLEDFQGTGLGLAIPAQELTDLMMGRIFPPAILPVPGGDGQATFQVIAARSDPLGKVKEAILHVWSGDAPPEMPAEPKGNAKLIPGATQYPLALGPQEATGSFKLPLSPNKKPTVLVQLECHSATGVSISPPARLQLVDDGGQTPADAIPMAAFQQNVSKFLGQTVVVRGKLLPGATAHGAVYELQAGDAAGSAPAGVTFLADRDIETQLTELTPMELALDVALTLRVNKQAHGSTTPVRITRLDFFSRENRQVKSIPAPYDGPETLIRLNRAPEKFVGRTLDDVVGVLSPVVLGRDEAPELSIMLKSERRPENLHFTTSPAIAKQVKSLDLDNELPPALLQVRVESKLLDGTSAQIVTVTRIEFYEKGGKKKVIE